MAEGTGSRADLLGGGDRSPAPPASTVVDVMLSVPKTLPGAATVADVRAELADEHVHLVLLTEGERLVGTIHRDDLPPAAAPDAPASAHATLAGRTVAAATPAVEAFERLVASGERRLAVVGPAGDLLGLLCLNRKRTGFCSDADVAARAAEAPGAPLGTPGSGGRRPSPA